MSQIKREDGMFTFFENIRPDLEDLEQPEEDKLCQVCGNETDETDLLGDFGICDTCALHQIEVYELEELLAP